MTSKQQGQLNRVLNAIDVLALGFGAMIGWGWIVLAGNWVLTAGSAGAIAAFSFGGIAMVLIGLVYAELASAMPLVGGEHVYSFRALGTYSSFICTWAIVLGYVSVVAFEAVRRAAAIVGVAGGANSVGATMVHGEGMGECSRLPGIGGVAVGALALEVIGRTVVA